MTRAAEPIQQPIPVAPASPSPAVATAASSLEQTLTWLKGKLTCPFCGTVTDRSDEACARCGMHDTGANRDATKARIGPWYVLQSRNPAAPGMTYATLMLLVKKGLVTARSIVRGPTTHQLWAFAAKVRGLSREFGVCWSCGQSVEKSALQCVSCGQSQKPPALAEDLVERPGQETRGESNVSEDILVNDTATRPPAGSMDIVLPTPGEESPAKSVPKVTDPVKADDSEPAARRGSGRILSDEQLNAPVRHLIRYPTESRWRRIRQGVGVLLLTSAVVLAFALFLFPDFRRTTLYWANERFDPIMQQWRAWGDRAKPAGVDDPTKFNSDGTPIDPSSKVEIRPKPGYKPRRTQPTAPPSSVDAPVLPKDNGTSAARQASASLVDEMVTQNLIRTLNASARAAETKGDYAAALGYYDQIRNVPERFWPDDLPQRIDTARAKVGNP